MAHSIQFTCEKVGFCEACCLQFDPKTSESEAAKTARTIYELAIQVFQMNPSEETLYNETLPKMEEAYSIDKQEKNLRQYYLKSLDILTTRYLNRPCIEYLAKWRENRPQSEVNFKGIDSSRGMKRVQSALF